MSKKKILINAFNMNCIGHINHGLWTHPRDNSTRFNTLEYWTELAQLLERGLFDGLFIADIVGVYDVYQQSVDVPLKEAIQLPVNDPLLLVSAMAAVTKNLGFGLTANLTYETPYLFARRMSTLDHLTRGRVGWNIVTGYLDSAAKAMGLTEQVEHDRRYDQADEYLQVLYKLWEGSWENDAVLNDRVQRIYARPDKVHKVKHEGEFYQVEGYHLCEPSPQRTPVLFQAGSSDRGLVFAGRHAECVFISGQTKAATKTTQSILGLLREINQRLGLTIILITHEMAVIRDICQRVVVLEQGRVVEQGPVWQVFGDPQHDVSKTLLAPLQDTLPAALQSRITAQPLSAQASVVLRLRFTGSQAQEPDLGALFSALGGQVRLLHGGVEHIQGHALGQLLLSVTSTSLGAEELRKRAGQWAQQVEVVGYGV
ncbi:NtaA/DmoA family FMN-dependent monooxygenase [Pseudomonas fragi]|nr:NtaA/DmoA family FMN-dependent monooxygenase [Pseudomonas fragi]